MTKPASYFSRLRRRKAAPKAAKHQAVFDEKAVKVRQVVASLKQSQAAKREVANEL